MLFVRFSAIIEVAKRKGEIAVKKTQKNRLFRYGDLVAILLVLVLTFGLIWMIFAAEEGQTVEVAVNGEVVLILPLDTDGAHEVTAGAHSLTVVIEKGSVYVCDADCPDHVCEQTGRISEAGRAIVCAPARISVRIVGGGERDADYVAG